MKKRILSISLVIITFTAFMTLMNCKKDDSTPAPCEKPDSPNVKKTVIIDEGGSATLTASLTAEATYHWTGPNNFSSDDTNLTFTNCTMNMTGEYQCVITVNGCKSNPASSFLIVRGSWDDPRGDGNGNAQLYKTVKIGSQIWMAENLKWNPPDFAADWKQYADKPNIGLVYGTLYDYVLANKAAAGLSTSGWRVPTDADWKNLITFLGGDTVAGSKLKEAGATHWTSPNTGASNTSGFTALGAGYYDVLNGLGFQDLGGIAYFWSATPYSSYMIIYEIHTESFWIFRKYGDKSNFYSIRLVKDA